MFFHWRACVLGAFLAALWLCLAQAVTAGALAGAKRTVIDSAGRQGRVSLPVHRIVVLTEDSLEVVRILEAGHWVVGVNEHVHRETALWQEFVGVDVVGNPFQP